MSQFNISLDRVFSNTWNSMVRILFKPFSLERWLVLGFCCWMISLTGDSGFFFNFTNRLFLPESLPRHSKTHTEFWTALDRMLNGTDGSLFQRIAIQLDTSTARIWTWFLIGIAVVIVLIALWLLCNWLRGRFEFIFLDNLLNDRCEIRKPWREFRKLGNSFFIGSTIFAFVILSIHLLALGICGALVFSWLSECAAAHGFVAFGGIRLITTIVLGGTWLLLTLLIGIYFWFFSFLLIQIMYRDRVGFLEGLRHMNVLLLRHLWECVLFWLMMMIFMFAFGLAILAAYVLTCGFALIVISIPYSRAVALLPYWVFLRLSGVELLQALDPREEPPPEAVIPEAEPVPAAGGSDD